MNTDWYCTPIWHDRISTVACHHSSPTTLRRHSSQYTHTSQELATPLHITSHCTKFASGVVCLTSSFTSVKKRGARDCTNQAKDWNQRICCSKFYTKCYVARNKICCRQLSDFARELRHGAFWQGCSDAMFPLVHLCCVFIFILYRLYIIKIYKGLNYFDTDVTRCRHQPWYKMDQWQRRLEDQPPSFFLFPYLIFDAAKSKLANAVRHGKELHTV